MRIGMSILIGLATGLLSSARAEPPARAPLAEIDAWLRAHQRDRPRATVGLAIVELPSGETLYEHNAGKALVPASNQKVLTTAVALHRLGRDFAFTTALCRLGEDLVVTGDADPTLGDPVLAARHERSIYADLDRWSARVRKLAGATIDGSLLMRSRIAPQKLWNPDWTARDRSRHYGAPVADLNFHNNCYDVTFQRDEKTARIVPVVQPASAFIDVDDQLRRGKRHTWRLIPAAGDAAVILKGTVRSTSRFPLSVPCDDPPLLLGRVLLDRLRRAGVEVKGGVRRVSPDAIDMNGATLLAGTRTPLPQVLARANKRSLNMAAEALLLRAGDGTWKGSARQMRQTLLEDFGFADSLVVRDGSGLSDHNRVAPRDLARLLVRMAGREDFDVFLASLPRNGIDGTMKRRLRTGVPPGRIAAKTGYIAGASALSGYVLDADGRPQLAFSMIVNGTTAGASNLANRVAAALGDSVAKDAPNED
jgi:D-alanyl-D-alanine carboxypeptidase/D-alanyl-D-alanine-endopeptidase (penicillin-binding protein 4)